LKKGGGRGGGERVSKSQFAHPAAASQRKSSARSRASNTIAAAMSATKRSKSKLLVIAHKDRKELDVLEKLPSSVEVVEIGTDFEHVSGALLESVDAVLMGSGPTGGKGEHLAKIFDKLTSLKWIHSNMVGLDLFMFPELLGASKGVTITNSKGVYSQSLAEYVLFAAKYFALDTPKLLKHKANKHWVQFPVQEISGKTICIIGYGDIGRATAVLAKAYGMKVLASRRNPSLSQQDPHLDKIYPTSDLEEMVRESDYVVVSTPLTEATKHIVDAKLLSVMKPTAVVINVGRGPCINEMALVETLKKGTIKGAALDVFEVEPLPQDSELWQMDNVMISFHNADRAENWLENSIQLFVNNMEKYMSGQELENIVDIHRGY
jgi:phosphoglycerate dehydrogenase-like enzyme